MLVSSIITTCSFCSVMVRPEQAQMALIEAEHANTPEVDSSTRQDEPRATGINILCMFTYNMLFKVSKIHC